MAPPHEELPPLPSFSVLWFGTVESKALGWALLAKIVAGESGRVGLYIFPDGGKILGVRSLGGLTFNPDLEVWLMKKLRRSLLG